MALSAFELCEETFGMSRDDLESIIAFLRSAESRQMSHSDVEKLVRERSYELSRKLFQAHVDSRGPGEAAAPVRGADGVERDQERIHERGLTTIFGEIRVKRFGYGAEGADSLHPLDAELNLPRERYSFELRRTAAVEVSKGAFDEAVASLGRHTGAKVGKRQVEELAGRAAEDFDAFYGQRAPPAGDRSASVLAITADGKGVVMLRKDLREATKKAAEKGSRRLGKRLTKGEKRNRKRMATVAAVYTVEPFVRQPSSDAGPPAPGTKDAARHSAPLPTPQAESRSAPPPTAQTARHARFAVFGFVSRPAYPGVCPEAPGDLRLPAARETPGTPALSTFRSASSNPATRTPFAPVPSGSDRHSSRPIPGSSSAPMN